ncbi:UDP-4-amino-4,6-dideoxy-N-acetyl-beta-L-altrosamine transaminase [Desulfolithobacter sp.]
MNIPYGRQEITAKDIEAVIEVLEARLLTQGPKVPEFEKRVARYCGVRHGVAVNSATSALHLACLALGLGPGDMVWTTPITFVASANCALYCGAGVDFVDIDARTGNLCPEALARKLVDAEKAGTLPKVVIPVHLCGQSCEMRAIHLLSRRYGFRIIEDASHAIGGQYRGRPVGCCRYSDITVFSFHPVKIITTGEGGMALTNDVRLARKMSRMRSHGITKDPAEMRGPADGPWYYEQIELGFNYRMTDLQAALGISQMGRLDRYIARRQELAGRYDSLLADLPGKPLWQHPDCRSSWHLYVIRLRTEELRLGHSQLVKSLREHGIGVQLHYIPLYRHPYYQRLGFDRKCYPGAEDYYAEAVTLPLFPTLTEADQDKIVDTLRSIILGR